MLQYSSRLSLGTEVGTAYTPHWHGLLSIKSRSNARFQPPFLSLPPPPPPTVYSICFSLVCLSLLTSVVLYSQKYLSAPLPPPLCERYLHCIFPCIFKPSIYVPFMCQVSSYPPPPFLTCLIFPSVSLHTSVRLHEQFNTNKTNTLVYSSIHLPPSPPSLSLPIIYEYIG